MPTPSGYKGQALVTLAVSPVLLFLQHSLAPGKKPEYSF